MALNMTFDPPPTHEHPAHQSHSRRFPSFSSSSSAAATAAATAVAVQHGQTPPPAYSIQTEDMLAAKYQRWSKFLNVIRIATAAITLIVSVPIVGTTGNSLKAYQSTNLGGKMYLPLWPTTVDLRPTHSILACGVVITTWSLIYLIVSFFPSVRFLTKPLPFTPPLLCVVTFWLTRMIHLKPRPKLHILNILSTIFGSTGLFLTIFTTMFVSIVNGHYPSDRHDAGSLMTWTCKWQGFEDIAPLHFAKICTESMVGLDLVILLVILELIAVVASCAGWWIEGRMKKVVEKVGEVKLADMGGA